MGIQLYQRVAFARDVLEHNLIKGDVAEVVERLPATKNSGGEEGYALEVFNAVGETIDLVMVPASAVKPLTEGEILHARPLYPTPPTKSAVAASRVEATESAGNNDRCSLLDKKSVSLRVLHFTVYTLRG